MKSLKWNILADASQPKETPQTLVQSVIDARGLKGTAVQFFQEDSTVLFSPFLLKDMQKAVEIVSNAIESGISICVYGDYDCDGVCATTMMHHYLESAGARVFYYIPHREKEGYGLNKLAIDEIARLGASLIITVDNGISAIEEIAYAHSIGIEVVVTDHHTPPKELPIASAIINPHQNDCEYPFKDLCGAGVAFKLLCALENEEGFGLLEQYGDLLAIATVADIVPLLSENRSILKEGLPLIQNSFRPGLKVLLQNAKLSEREITSDSIAFGLAPRINAAGRIDSADTAVMLLSTESDEEALELGNVLEQLNLKRRELEKVIVDDIAQTLEQEPTMAYKKIPVFSGIGWNAGVVGIVCSRLSERFGRPVLIASIEEDGSAKGSGRSVTDFSLIKAITNSADTLERYGGHPMAAGFSLNGRDILQFSKDLNDYCPVILKLCLPLF